MTRNKSAYKYETPFKRPYKIVQTWTKGTVTFRTGAVTMGINIRNVNPFLTHTVIILSSLSRLTRKSRTSYAQVASRALVAYAQKPYYTYALSRFTRTDVNPTHKSPRAHKSYTYAISHLCAKAVLYVRIKLLYAHIHTSDAQVASSALVVYVHNKSLTRKSRPIRTH